MQEFYLRMREVLLEERTKLKESLHVEHESFDELIHQHTLGDSMDEVSSTIDKQLLEHLGANMQLALQRIESALSRLENGTYGTCVRCSKMIAQERLEAMPEASMCIHCQKTEIKSH